MKKPLPCVKACYAFLIALLLSCSKDQLLFEEKIRFEVVQTTPYSNNRASDYDINISVDFNLPVDSLLYDIRLEVTQHDTVISGSLNSHHAGIEFIPLHELLHASDYKAEVIISKKGTPSDIVCNYNWQFTTKVADEFLMTQRSTHVTDFNRDGTRCMQIGKSLYSFGGWAVPEESFNDVYKSDGDLSVWQRLPNAPWHGRHVYGIAKIADSTYIIGGDNLQPAFDVWRTVDGEHWTLMADNILSNRIYFGCTVHNGFIYIVGGSGINDVWRSANGIKWEQVAKAVDFLQGECFTGSLASFKGKLWMICGGTNGFGQGTIRKEVWSSIDGVKWNRENDFAGSKRYYTDVCVWDNKLWVVGGFNFEEGNTQSIWYMKPDGSWKEFTPPSNYIGRHATGLAVYNNQLTITCGNYNNDCWVIEKIK